MAKKDNALMKKSHPQTKESVETKQAREQFHKSILDVCQLRGKMQSDVPVDFGL